MLRIKSVRNTLEDYLYTKVNNKEDNISFYYIILNNKKYKIVSVNAKGIDLEMV
jgi:ABC-type transporter MlaC component